MITVIVVIHLLIAIAMIGMILLQKTEGNAAGGGFSASAGLGSMQPRARANPLSRATQILGFAFFATSLGLALLARQHGGPAPSIVSDAPTTGTAPRVDEIRPPSEPEAAKPTVTLTPAPAGASPEAPPAASPAPTAPQVPNN